MKCRIAIIMIIREIKDIKTLKEIAKIQALNSTKIKIKIQQWIKRIYPLMIPT